MNYTHQIIFLETIFDNGLSTSPTVGRVILALIAAFGGLSIAVVYIREGDLFHPLAFVLLSYLVTLGGPMFDLALRGADVYEHELLGNDIWYVIWPAVLVLFGIWALLLGYRYLPIQRNIRWNPGPFETDWNHIRARQVTAVFVLIGIVSLFFYLLDVGIPTNLSDLSVHRRVSTRYIEWGATFILYGAIIAWAEFLESDRPTISSWGLILSILVTLSIFFATFRGSRSLLIRFILVFMIIFHYRRHRLKFKSLVVVGLIATILSNGLLYLRELHQSGSIDTGLFFSSPYELFHSTFGMVRGRFTMVAHIVNMTPEELEFRYGTTFFKWIVFPIPRAIWSEKPVFLGRELSIRVFGMPTNGTPPTIIGELYLNFWIPGIIIGMLLLGAYIRLIIDLFENRRSSSMAAGVLYGVICAYFVGFASLTPLVISALRWLVPFGLAMGYITNTPLRFESILGFDRPLTQQSIRQKRIRLMYVNSHLAKVSGRIADLAENAIKALVGCCKTLLNVAKTSQSYRQLWRICAIIGSLSSSVESAVENSVVISKIKSIASSLL